MTLNSSENCGRASFFNCISRLIGISTSIDCLKKSEKCGTKKTRNQDRFPEEEWLGQAMDGARVHRLSI
jgi:hypothetical protein